jgi:hypothetical protein
MVVAGVLLGKRSKQPNLSNRSLAITHRVPVKSSNRWRKIKQRMSASKIM